MGTYAKWENVHHFLYLSQAHEVYSNYTILLHYHKLIADHVLCPTGLACLFGIVSGSDVL